MISKLDILKRILCCPKCKSDLQFDSSFCNCHACDIAYPIMRGKFYFRGELNQNNHRTDFLDRFKSMIKRFSEFYNFLIIVISPVFSKQSILRKVIHSDAEIKVNIGSGNVKINDQIINCDFFDYENVDVILDVNYMPFKYNSIDLIINIALLEHITEAKETVKSFYNIIKPGGKIFTIAPFIQPFHASPNDFRRFTLEGIKNLHQQFKEINSGVYSGPVSGFLWVFQEFIAILFSFGNIKLHYIIQIIMMLLLFPIKFLDAIFINLKTAKQIASNHYFLGEK